MTADARQRLCSLKDELVSLEPWPWNNIAAWSAKATPTIRSDWSDHLDDFRKAIVKPRFTKPINVLLGDQQEGTDDSENKLKAKQAKERILSFLEGLLTATEHPASPGAVSFNKNDPIAAVVEATGQHDEGKDTTEVQRRRLAIIRKKLLESLAQLETMPKIGWCNSSL